MIFRSHFLCMKYILHPSLLRHQLPCGSDFGGLHKVEYLAIEHWKSRKANENGIHRFIFRPCISIQDSNSPLVLKVSDKNTNLKENTTNRNIYKPNSYMDGFSLFIKTQQKSGSCSWLWRLLHWARLPCWLARHWCPPGKIPQTKKMVMITIITVIMMTLAQIGILNVVKTIMKMTKLCFFQGNKPILSQLATYHQASLTIFGVVGGPLLGLFTLGVLARWFFETFECKHRENYRKKQKPTSRRVEERGAIFGFLTGLAFVAWIGFGGPKPPPEKLPVSISNCTFSPGWCVSCIFFHS